VEKMLSAGKSFAEFSDELEDFLLAEDSEFVAKMRAARAAHLSGKAQPLARLARRVASRAKLNKHDRKRA
jgi:hypothetical protein